MVVGLEWVRLQTDEQTKTCSMPAMMTCLNGMMMTWLLCKQSLWYKPLTRPHVVSRCCEQSQMHGFASRLLQGQQEHVQTLPGVSPLAHSDETHSNSQACQTATA